MSSGLRPAFILSVISLFLPPFLGGVAASELRKILARLEEYQDAIRSFDVRLEATWRWLIPPQADVQRSAFRQVYQRGKGRVEFVSNTHQKGSACLVYDEKIQKYWNPEAAHSRIRRPIGPLLEDGMDYLTPLRNLYWGLPILRCFTERKDVQVKESGGPAPMVILEAAPETEPANIHGFRVYLDTIKSFRPLKTEQFWMNQDLAFVTATTVTEWHEIGGRTEVPSKTITRFSHSMTGGGPPEVTHEITLAVDVARSSWNTEIAEETFELPLPAGTQVFDELRGLVYELIEPDPGKNLEELLTHARVVSVLNRKPPPAAKPKPRACGLSDWVKALSAREPAWLEWLLAAASFLAAVVITCGTIFFFGRRRMRRAPSHAAGR
jgi:hypothetical protein